MGRGRFQKYREFKVQDKTRGVGTIYHKRVNPNMETLAAANVSIFGFTLVAAANVSKYGNISSCYHPQPWELRHCKWECEGMSATGVDQSTESTEKAQAPGSNSRVTPNLTKPWFDDTPELSGLLPRHQNAFSVVWHRRPQTTGASLKNFYC